MSVMIAQTTGYIINNTSIPMIIQDHGRVRTAHVDIEQVEGVFLIGYFEKVGWLYMVKRNNQYLPFYMIGESVKILHDNDIIITWMYMEDMTSAMYEAYNEIISAVNKVLYLKK